MSCVDLRWNFVILLTGNFGNEFEMNVRLNPMNHSREIPASLNLKTVTTNPKVSQREKLLIFQHLLS
jgi:hypothetical protein